MVTLHGGDRASLAELQVGGARLRMVVLDGSPVPDLDHMHAWLTDAAQMVAGLSGRFPVAQAQILVVPDARGNEPTPWAYVMRGGNPAVHFFINQRRPPEEFYDDWTATHELAHLLLPFVDYNDAWLSEGVATYYQTVLRARAGRMSEREALMRATTSSSSSGVSGRNGGEEVPATISPGNRAAIVAASVSATPGAPP